MAVRFGKFFRKRPAGKRGGRPAGAVYKKNESGTESDSFPLIRRPA